MAARARLSRRLCGASAIGLTGVLALLITPASAFAQKAEGPPASPQQTGVYQLYPVGDVAVSVLATIAGLGFEVRKHTPPAHCAPLCDTGELSALDLRVAGNYSTQWRAGSHAGVSTIFVGGLALLLTDGDWLPALRDTAVVAETVLVTAAANVLLTHAVDRPRPYVYGTRAPLDKRMAGDGHLSFPSGHTASASAATVATAFTLFRRRKHAKAWAALLVGSALTAMVGVSRSLAGDHFPTDVMAGAAFGAGMGMLVPALHLPPRGTPMVNVGRERAELSYRLAF